MPSMLQLPLLLPLLLLSLTFCVHRSSSRAALCRSRQFDSSLNYRGCPLFVRQVDPRTFLLEPVLCLLQRPTRLRIQFDPVTNAHFVSLPLSVLPSDALAVAASALSTESSNSSGQRSEVTVKFAVAAKIRVENERLLSAGRFDVKAIDLVWRPGESSAALIIAVETRQRRDEAVSPIAMLRWLLVTGRFDLVTRIRASVTLRSAPSCQPFKISRAIHVANQTVTLSDLRIRDTDLAAHGVCDNHKLVKHSIARVGNCHVDVYKVILGKGRYSVAPAFCYNSVSPVLLNYDNPGVTCCEIRVRLKVTDKTVVAAVARQLAKHRPTRVEKMEIVQAEIVTSAWLRRWRFDEISFAADRASAEMRIHCRNWRDCHVLRSLISANSLSFWRHVTITGRAVVANNCIHDWQSVHAGVPSEPDFLGRTSGGRSPDGMKRFVEAHQLTIRQNRTFVILQQRVNDSVNFNRSWDEYVRGFGDEQNFWIGLSLMHKLTQRPRQLRIELTLRNSSEFHAEYQQFRILDEKQRFRMIFIQFDKAQSTTVYDALSTHKSMYFSTKNRDYDRNRGSCSKSHGSGGFWYNNCHNANLNGIYSSAETSSTKHFVWRFKEGYKALRMSRIMIEV